MGTFAEGDLMSKLFTPWALWADRAALPDLSYPGVYALAVSSEDISGTGFSCCFGDVYDLIT